jgi:hypothetical protein
MVCSGWSVGRRVGLAGGDAAVFRIVMWACGSPPTRITRLLLPTQ